MGLRVKFPILIPDNLKATDNNTPVNVKPEGGGVRLIKGI